MKVLLLAGILSTALALPAFADCVDDIGRIDQALAAGPQITDQQMSEVRSLRSEGESLCVAGQNDEAMVTLAKAKAILGLE
ncbi:MAG: hypothetical protein GY791_11925 [Alphaproteobacteria bacterium]|nr:hypothetical protein [Alphaproteobacteria bacterium]